MLIKLVFKLSEIKLFVVIISDISSLVSIELLKFFISVLISIILFFNLLVFAFKFKTFSSKELILLLINFDSGKLIFNLLCFIYM